MRTFTIAALTCLSVISACQQTPGYKITGNITGAQDGDTVMLLKFVGWNPDTLAQTVIKNNEFTFTGRQDTADIRYISYIKNGEGKAGSQLFLENGDIQINIDPKSFTLDVKGTPTNEAWCAFYNEDEKRCGKSLDLYRALNDTVHPLDSITAKQKQTEMEALDKETLKHRIQFCKDNIQNVAGVYTLLFSYMKDFEEETVAQLLEQAPSIYFSEDIAFIKEEFANKKKTAVGQPFIDFSLNTPDGKSLSIAEIANANKVIMIDFWASWCGPCRAEMPSVKAAYEKYHQKGFEIIGVSLDNSEDAWKKAIESLGLTWPQISDLKGWECAGAMQYGVRSIPATFLIQNGKIIAKDLRGEEIEKKLEEIL